jgi:hypothetical protein
MDHCRSGNSRKLTGVWQGTYTYPSGAPTVPFTATLIEAGNLLSGSVHEPCLMLGSPNEILFATLNGTRHDSAVSFVKTYDGSNPNYRSVSYEGCVNGDATEIEGRWKVPRDWSGRFLMIRSGNQPAEAARRKEESLSVDAGRGLTPVDRK